MKKTIYFIFSILIFLIFSINVNAALGDLIYNVDSVEVSNSGILIKGYSFIHKTNNYHTIYKKDGNGRTSSTEIVASDGGQETKILVANCDYSKADCKSDSNNYIIKSYSKNASTSNDYNFYYQQFTPGTGLSFSASTYNDPDKNKCGNNSQCYYEDVYFSIRFSVEELAKFSNQSVYFYIASCNNYYKNSWDSDGCTDYNPLSVAKVNGQSDYIEINQSKLNGKVDFIAGKAYWRVLNSENVDSRYTGKDKFYGCTRPSDTDPTFGQDSWCGTNYTERLNNSRYYLYMDDNSLKRTTSNVGVGGANFLDRTISPGVYAFCVNKETRVDGCGMTDEELEENNYFCNKCASDAKLLYAFTSYVEIQGDLSAEIKNPYLCEVTKPLPNELKCNNSGTLSSVCAGLTVHTDKGSAIVKIEQTGTVSSVLTPDKIYEGGGFNFGIMYQNNIKWSYVGSRPGTELHDAINTEMNKKIKDYESYILSISVSNLTLGGEVIRFGDSNDMVKQCFSSSTSKNYYGSEGLTVSCIFTFPSSSIAYDGEVTYNTTSSININNKYYTLLGKGGDFPITATISGMDRITSDSSEEDSKEKGKPWTGTWEDSIDGCKINVYKRLYTPNFIYRPIDINNPFPNRNAGINWYDWYNVSRNKERLENTYSDLDYIATLNNSTISDIKNYNKNHKYLDWYNINVNTGRSSFVTEYVERVGDS